MHKSFLLVKSNNNAHKLYIVIHMTQQVMVSTDHAPPMLVKCLLLKQPSSAAAERAFSLLTNSFNDEQRRSLEGYIELSIMLQYM